MENKTVLVINAGSSSLKYKLFSFNSLDALAEGLVERIGLEMSVVKHTKFIPGNDKEKKVDFVCKNHEEAMTKMIELLTDKEVGVIKNPDDIVIIGHRVV